MKFSQWLKDIEYELVQGSPDIEVTDLAYDSRKVAAGAVFICIRGTNRDSHELITEAVKKGALAIVIEKEMADLPPAVTVIRVKNSRSAMAYLSAARFHEPLKKMISIGITGTKGKTTTSYMIKAMLEAAGKTVGLIGTAGVLIGKESFPTVNTTPESYQLHQYFAKMQAAGCEYVIMEVSSQGIMMHRTAGIIFDYGIFTNISNDHIGPGEHQDFAEYLFYKSQMMKICRIGLINRDDPYYETLVSSATCKLHTYGIEQSADFQGTKMSYRADADFVGVEFLMSGRLSCKMRVGIPGKFNVYNALAAIGVGSLLALPVAMIEEGLRTVQVNGRMEIVYSSSRCTVIVDYAHNAVSMESLLLTLRDYHPKRLVCVFGCGGNRSKDRRYAMGEIGGRLADLCIITADNSRFEKVTDIMADIRGSIEKTGGSFLEIADRKEAIAYSILHSEPGDMIAIIGKGHEDYQEIEGVRYPFLDRAVVAEIIGQWES